MDSSLENCEVLENLTLDEVTISPEQYNDILNIQNEILSMLASHGNYTDILERLCTLAESLLPNSVASIMLVDKDTGLMSVLSAPSVPPVGHEALQNLKPGPGGGSCGNAVFRNEAQYVQDTFNDARWVNLRHVAVDFNLCSCWSMPIRDENNNPQGSFALSSFEHRSPASFHKKLLETAASIVNIVLKNQVTDKRIKLFSTAMQNAAEGMIITNDKNEIIEVNSAFEKIYGYTEEYVLGKNPSILSSGKHEKIFYENMWKNIITDNKWSGEILNKRADDSEINQWMSISALNYEGSQTSDNYLAIFSDLTELRDSQNKVLEMAFTDILTGLSNKASLEESISSTQEATLILLNINNFSYINSAYGFDIGDNILLKIAAILKNNFGAHTTARINSDEFALLFHKQIDITEKIVSIQNHFCNNQLQINDINLTITFSYGGNNEQKNIFRNTALALKKAKENGKNRYYIYDNSTDAIDYSQRDAFIASNNLLHDALKNDKLVPFFQGIRDNNSNNITKFESLARIVDNNTVTSPFMFIEAAKLSGMLPQITKIMIDKSFQEMSKNDFIFSINITEEDLSLHYLIEYLKSKASEYKIDPSRVILEILEGISSDGKKNHIKQLKSLKELGFKIAIDDFGTEYSNFERVLDLEIDFLKIDAKYIKDIHTNPKSLEITKAITFFAKNTGIPCIAEFVHNEEVQKIVKELGIDYSQGYLFSEPKPLS